MKTTVAVVALCVAIASTKVAAQASPVTSEYFKTKGGGTALDSKEGVRFAYFGLILEPMKPLPEGAVLVTEFENPQDASKPLTTEYTPSAGEREIVLKSSTYTCVVNNRDYRISVKLFTDRERKVLLSEHIQAITFSMPKRYMKQAGLKECDS
jgi:hypothetical protein